MPREAQPGHRQPSVPVDRPDLLLLEVQGLGLLHRLGSPASQGLDLRLRWSYRPGLSSFYPEALRHQTELRVKAAEVHNELQARYWSTSYPIEAAVEVMRLVDSLNSRLPMKLHQNLLVLQSPEDEVVSAEATRQAFERVSAPRKQLIEIEDAEDPSNHVLAGDILAPGSTGRIAAVIVSFVAGR